MNLSFDQHIQIGQKRISDNDPVFIIAEAGVNHNGDMSLAKRLIDIAAEAKADAVKFQTFKADHLILRSVDKAPYQQVTTSQSESQFEMLKRLEVTIEQNIEIREYCKSKDIVFLTTPFDEHSLEELEELDLPAYKIASTDTTNLNFLEKVAKTDKPIILSTGMSYMAEVELALKAIQPYNQQLILLQCTANYPIKDDEANLAVVSTYREVFDCIVGYSDHSVGVGAAPYSVPLGAKVIEKHFTLDKSMDGPDHLASLSPKELVEFVETIRRVEKYLGNGLKYPTLSEMKTRVSLQKCLVAQRPIKEGEPFSSENIIAKRTGGSGISPIYISQIFGRISSRDYQVDDIIEQL